MAGHKIDHLVKETQIGQKTMTMVSSMRIFKKTTNGWLEGRLEQTLSTAYSQTHERS